MKENSAVAIGETDRLCQFIHATAYDDIPADVISHAKKMLVDSVGVALAAVDSEAVQLVETITTDQNENSGSARLLGTEKVGASAEIALLTGVMAHALAFDDVHHEMGGHPSTPILAALLPVADQTNASGKAFLRSYIVGTEVEISLANVLNPGLYERGWHPTAVLGVLGAAAAVGSLIGLNRRELRNTLGIAASRASGTKGNFGTPTKPLHIGDAARNGLEAAHLAMNGFSANEAILETPFGGYCDLFQGEPEYEFADHLDRLGSPWGIITPPVGFKPYPCCGSTHSAIDAALQIRNNHEITAEDVQSITVVEHPRRLGHSNRPSPETPLDAKLSVQYCVTMALFEGDVWLDHFTESELERVLFRSNLELVDIEADPDRFGDREWGARVEVETRSNQYAVEVDAPLGSAERPLDWEQIEEKYRRCANRSLSAEEIERSLAVLQRTEEIADISNLLDHLTLD